MSKIELTPQQYEATVNCGGPLLVSASAGSGKTKVLVDRLLKEVLSGKCDVDDFLIITFTNAAAAELRGRILSAISDMLSQNPNNKHLRKQADLCSRAHIETIHSFCTSVIRENAHLCGISPEFRIADDAESNQLKIDSLNEVLEELYNSEDSEFIALADTLGAGRDDSRLVQIILDLYDKLMSHPHPRKWIENQLKMFEFDTENDAADTLWGKFLVENIKSRAKYILERCSNLLKNMEDEPDFYAAYGASVEGTKISISTFIDALSRGWDSAKNAAVIDFPNVKRIKGYDELKDERKAIKAECDKFKSLFNESSEKVIADMIAVKPIVAALFDVVLKFERCYAEKKKKRGVIDFSDQEHLALNILIDEDTGEATSAAKEFSKRFVQIMVDEYQDVNAVQDMIFTSVSRNSNNVFMVGDVKQSIYRFRLADPTIFLSKYNSYKNYPDAAAGEGRYIVLAENFRSRGGIIDAVNFIFKNILSVDFGEMAYTDKEALKCGAVFPDNFENSIELDFIETASALENKSLLRDKRDIEAAFVAKRIKEIVGKTMISDGAGGLRPVRYGDISILMRSLKNKLPKYTQALINAGIPVATEKSEDYFANIEVSIAVSLLTIIDNPRQDIPLLAVLRSPLYGFTSEELAVIRAEKRSGDYYSALLHAAKSSDKCRRFINDLESFRLAAPDMRVSELISFVAEKTGLFAVVSAMHNGSHRRANLMLLFEYAKSFESTEYKGLFGFVQYLRRMMETGKGISSDSVPTDENAVRIMSIHKSKGMEFPVVFLTETTSKMNTSDSSAPLLIHPKLGIGAKRVDIKRRIEYPTLSRKAVQVKIREEAMAEELRVLYVAMTRAREKLIITAPVSSVEKELSKCADAPLPVPPQRLAEESSMFKWIILPALRRNECRILCPHSQKLPADICGEAWDVKIFNGEDILSDRKCKTAGTESVSTERETAIFEDKFSFVYPFSNISDVPSKITATELNGGIKEAESAENAYQMTKTFGFDTFTPAFMDNTKKLTAAEKGIAAHTVMQYANFEHCLTKEDAAGEIERLRALGIISNEQAEVVDGGIVSAFINSDVGKRILSAEKIWREFKFSVLVNSSKFGFEGNEEILLQGVIDCCIEENGELVIIDYKTDYVTDLPLKEKAEYYSGQLNAYALSMEKIFKKPVKEKILYFLSAGKSICVK